MIFLRDGHLQVLMRIQPDYKRVMFGSISIRSNDMDYLRFKDSVTDIIIRFGYAVNKLFFGLDNHLIFLIMMEKQTTLNSW